MAGFKRKYQAKTRKSTYRKKLTKRVRDIVAASTGYVVRYPRTDPPAFKGDRSWTRTIRTPVTADQNAITVGTLLAQEFAYYGRSEIRWGYLKVRCLTFYGKVGGAPIAVRIAAGASGQTDAVSYSDLGDGTHRACIKVIYPPTFPGVPVGRPGDILASFDPDTIDLIDCYCELC